MAKKLLVALLAFCMILSFFPVSVQSEEIENTESFMARSVEIPKNESSSDILDESPDNAGIVHIYFDPQGGHAFVTKRVSSVGGNYGRMPVPYWGFSRTKHTFLGWFTAAEGGKQVKEGEKLAFNYDHTLYAHWGIEEQPTVSKTVMIYLDAQGGTCYVKSLFSSTGSTYSSLPTPYWSDTQLTHTFLGWFTQPTGGVQVKNGDKLAYNSDHTLYAHWSLTPAPELSRTVVIHLDPQGGTCFGTTLFSATNKQYGRLPTPYWIDIGETHTFLGWFTEPEKGKEVKSGDTLVTNSDHTLYAHWEVKPAPQMSETVIITLDALGGTCFVKSLFSKVNGVYQGLPSITWGKDFNKYEFLGWFTEPEGGEQVHNGDKLAVNDDHTVYAHWGEQTKKTTIVVTTINTGTRTNTYIPAKELSEALGESYDLSTPSITFQTEDATVSYDAEALQAISDQLEAQGGEPVAVGQDARISQENEQGVIWNIEMVALYADEEGTMHSVPVHDLGSGHMMVTVAYEKPENWDEDNLVVYRLDANGNIVEELLSSHSSINDTMSWISSEKCQFMITNKATTPENVENKVSSIAQECRNAGITGEWEIALWLHDWLIYHATYDYSLSYYSPTGVLLTGVGVCQSYSEAYALLLDAFQIQNVVVVAPEMNHAWNLVRLGGEWCHIDCTWDDPGTGGAENHTYFGMNDDLIARDHTWSRGSYTHSTSLQNYYPIRCGEPVFSNAEELNTILVPLFASQKESITIQYIGTDPEVTALSAFEEWYSNNNWKYGIRSFSSTYGKYICTIHDIVYTEPWEQPANKLAQPVSAPAFSMNSPNGNFSLSSYRGNGLILVFGREGCLNTRGLLQRLQAELKALHRNGIEVIISVENAENYADIQAVRKDYPSFNYCYEQQGLLSAYLEAVDYYNTYDTGWVTYPCVFLINGSGKITYYSTGYVSNLNELVSEAFALSNLNPLPVPAANQYSVTETGNANLASIGDGNVKCALQAACAKRRGVFFLTDISPYYYDSLMMQKWEDSYSLFDAMGLSFVACFMEVTEEDRQAFPHITFVEYDESDPFFWDLLGAVDWDFTKPAYYQCSYFLEHDGHIADYRNGGTLSVWDKIAVLVRDLSYDMILPAQLREIDEEAFLGSAFTSVDLSKSGVSSIGSMAFANCSNLRFVKLPDRLINIDPSAFQNSENVIIICSGNSEGAIFAEENNIPIICP